MIVSILREMSEEEISPDRAKLFAAMASEVEILIAINERLSKEIEAMKVSSPECTDEEAIKMIWDRWPRISFDGHKAQALQYMDFRHGANEMFKLIRERGYISSAAT